ncbi:uncharacterized protein LOC111713950 isoform X2 [Eurytemora carolleeae]|uniref:uncharacterized protein LOC111713950 isoform X2 n=1 Tax=Eurytemora carolleeae TaxID=1294199 RepID=UPI000C77121F|nr:uncharacterized protein LOC111713950 isoform X2 [Eurytemora carolleeae]|eukprot:XP_023344715.1 uncharacterized protein LOC111713950 isoform X2 [Eurytemora affinis]
MLYLFKRKPVLSLEKLALLSFQRYLTDHCWVVSNMYSGTEFEQVVKREEVLWLHIQELREHIFSHVSIYVQEDVVQMIISAVNEAAEDKRKQYTMNTEIGRYKTELYCIVTMVDLIVSPQIRRLELPNIPKVLRTHLISRLRSFTGLHFLEILLLGFGKDSRMVDSAEIVAPSNIIDALRSMSSLTHLILPTFCTNNLLACIARSQSKKTLRRLEINHSESVGDSGAVHITKFENLELLGITETNVGLATLAIAIFGLPKLKNLPMGDFLCDVLEFVEMEDTQVWRRGDPCPRLKIQEFCCSEIYHFHSTKQMTRVSNMCPYIREVSFFYDGEELCELNTLSLLPKLVQLKLNGGDVSKDPIREFFEMIGPRLERLELNHIENIDKQFIVQLSVWCPNLQYLSFSACSFLDYASLHRELFEYANSEGLDTIEQIELVELNISSSCSRVILVFILLCCQKITRLNLGTYTDLTDDVMQQIISVNPLTRLEFLHVHSSKYLTKYSLDLILTSCTSLREIKGLPYWSCVGEDERNQLVLWIKKNNVDLSIPEIISADQSSFFNTRVELTESIRKFLSTQ